MVLHVQAFVLFRLKSLFCFKCMNSSRGRGERRLVPEWEVPRPRSRFHFWSSPRRTSCPTFRKMCDDTHPCRRHPANIRERGLTLVRQSISQSFSSHCSSWLILWRKIFSLFNTANVRNQVYGPPGAVRVPSNSVFEHFTLAWTIL